MKKILLTLAACLTAFNANTAPLTPADYSDLRMSSEDGTRMILKSDSIRRSNEYLIAKIEYPDSDNEHYVVDMFDCAGSRIKTVRIRSNPIDVYWRFITGGTNGASMLDHTCYIGKKTGLIK